MWDLNPSCKDLPPEFIRHELRLRRVLAPQKMSVEARVKALDEACEKILTGNAVGAPRLTSLKPVEIDNETKILREKLRELILDTGKPA